MKIAVIGTGALGCLFGAKFSTENEVILLAYTQKDADIIKQNGLTLKEPDDTVSHYPNVTAFESGTYEQPVDVVVILVKTPQTESALKQNLNLIGDNTIILTLQNGLGNYEVISQYVEESQIILGTTNHNSVLLDVGAVFHGGAGITTIGGPKASSENVQKIYELFTKSGFECAVSDNIGYLLWKKLFVNLTINSFTYITLTPIGFICHNSYAMNYVQAIINEAVAVARAEGYDFDAETTVNFVKDVAAAHLMGYSSMSQDRKRGFKTEIDWINGAVVKLAHKHGLSVPYNELVVNLVHAIEDADIYNKTIE